jgi:hypothetical protein
LKSIRSSLITPGSPYGYGSRLFKLEKEKEKKKFTRKRNGAEFEPFSTHQAQRDKNLERMKNPSQV